MHFAERQRYDQLLLAELQPALGCTEPIALAYATALAKSHLGAFPEHIKVLVSGNIVKNVKSVTIPNSGGMVGLAPAMLLGLVGGNAALELEVLSGLTEEHLSKVKQLIKEDFYTIGIAEGKEGLYIAVEMSTVDDKVSLIISGDHTNVIYLQKNDKVVIDKNQSEQSLHSANSYDFLTMAGICDYIEQPLDDKVISSLARQIEYNSKISAEGLNKTYGVAVGKMLNDTAGDRLEQRIVAATAAGSDARMGGSLHPVVINSGSGNQGLTVSLPVITYAEQHSIEQAKLYRALALSNLISVRIKYGMGNLSAFCGAVSAAAGSGAAITYLAGGNRQQIYATVVNTLGNLAGIVCDGAKASCAVKVASSVNGALIGHQLAMHGQAFKDGEGLVLEDIEKTIDHYAKLGLVGMKETDKVILDMMTE